MCIFEAKNIKAMKTELAVFLLGGYDLEMITIKHILEGRDDCLVIDKHLDWGSAKLSCYKKEMDLYSDATIYGIELQEDIPIPDSYQRIDHHNDYSDKPSSLEQVAIIINHGLNRYEQLVAANDKGYIPAMMAMQASPEEIEVIRKKDRMAQGVSEPDERLAEQALKNDLKQYPRLWTVRSKSSCFSPICDRLFPYPSLLIYTDEEWMLYGKGKKDLTLLYEEEIKQGKIFHGGGDYGYIGSVKNAYSQTEILRIVEQIKLKYASI